MPHIITRIEPSVEQNWLKQLANAISDPSELLSLLEIDPIPWQKGFAARELFPMRVPMSFVDRMEKGNPNDPLLKQVLPLFEEYDQTPGYSADPLDEQNNQQPGLLHKYHNRVLMIVKGGCAINCRYCFRRHFPYADNKGSKSVWQESIDYIKQHPELNEVILSGGDPLMAKDSELEWLINSISDIEHIQTLRITQGCRLLFRPESPVNYANCLKIRGSTSFLLPMLTMPMRSITNSLPPYRS